MIFFFSETETQKGAALSIFLKIINLCANFRNYKCAPICMWVNISMTRHIKRYIFDIREYRIVFVAYKFIVLYLTCEHFTILE